MLVLLQTELLGAWAVVAVRRSTFQGACERLQTQAGAVSVRY